MARAAVQLCAIIFCEICPPCWWKISAARPGTCYGHTLCGKHGPGTCYGQTLCDTHGGEDWHRQLPRQQWQSQMVPDGARALHPTFVKLQPDHAGSMRRCVAHCYPVWLNCVHPRCAVKRRVSHLFGHLFGHIWRHLPCPYPLTANAPASQIQCLR